MDAALSKYFFEETVIERIPAQKMKSVSLTTSQLGFTVSGYAFSAGISGLLTAGFADRFDRKKLLLFFYIGFIACTVCCFLPGSLRDYFSGVIGSISMAIMADLFSLLHVVLSL